MAYVVQLFKFNNAFLLAFGDSYGKSDDSAKRNKPPDLPTSRSTDPHSKQKNYKYGLDLIEQVEDVFRANGISVNRWYEAIITSFDPTEKTCCKSKFGTTFRPNSYDDWTSQFVKP